MGSGTSLYRFIPEPDWTRNLRTRGGVVANRFRSSGEHDGFPIARLRQKELMPLDSRELYTSPNGDRWSLARNSRTGRVFIRHKANLPSGGQVTDIEIGDFLSEGRGHPEHQALLQLIGTLVVASPPDLKQPTRRTR